MPVPTVLVVDDEHALRGFVCTALERDGYTALEASHPKEAIEIVRGYQGRIDLVLTDVHMPDMCGTELVPLLLARRPGMRVLYMSGFLDEIPPGDVVPLLEKPFTVAALRLAVERALSEARVAA